MTPPIPTRVRPFEKTQAPTPLWQSWLLGRSMAPSRAEYDRVCRGLLSGDPAMDDLVDWMHAFGPSRSRGLFQQAVAQGIDSVPHAPTPLRAFFEAVETVPGWVDFKLIGEGVRFIHGTGMAAPAVLRDLALMGGYMLSGFNHVLIMTGALNKDASRRVAETGQWWMDCTEPDGLVRQGPGYRSTFQVRLVHAMIRRHLSARDDWDAGKWGVPLSQIDMVATYLGFCVVMLGGLRKLGIPVTAQESRAVMHLWAYACWLMGVDEEWLVFSEKEGMVLLYHTFMTQTPPDWTSQEMARALADEPLQRSFDYLAPLQRRLAWFEHLSNTRFFLGEKKMQQLGLPVGVGPWAPLARLPWRTGTYAAGRWVGPLRRPMERRGRAAQRAALASMFGQGSHAVGTDRDQHLTG